MPATIGMLKREGTATWLYEALKGLVESQLQHQQGFAAILRGEAPDGTGGPLIDTGQFFFKPGLPGNQIGHGGTGPAGTLTFSSTKHSTKGFIYLGLTSPRFAYDETNCFLGLGTDTPSVRLHLKPDANSRYILMEPTTFTVACTITFGSAVVTGGSFAPTGGPRVVPGMLITGTGIPANTYVKSLDSGSQLTMTQNASGGGSSATFQSFVRFEDKNDETGGKEVQFRSFGGIRFTPGPPDASGIDVPLRIVGDNVAWASGIAASQVVYLETGYINTGVAVGTNLQIGGPGHGELAHLNIWSRTTWIGRSPASGTNANISIGSLNPAEFGVVAAGFGPSVSLIVAPGTNAHAAAFFGNAGGGNTSIIDVFHGTSGGVVSGSSPNKVIDHTAFIMRVTENTRFWLGNAAGGSVYQNGGSDSWTLSQGSNDLQLLQASRNSAWSDTVAAANSFYLQLGTVNGGHRALYLSSSGNVAFTRFGISSAYTLISNGAVTAGGAGFQAPEASPSVLRLYNAATGGADASILLKLESARSGQTGDFIRVLLQAGTTPFLVQSTGKVVMTVAPQIDIASAATGFVWTATDNDGNGVWAAAASSSVTVRKNSGADVGTRPRLNFIEGSNITLTIADDAGSNEIDITIASSGGGGSTFSDAVFRIFDDGDNTKNLALQISGVTTATTRTWTVQDVTGTVPILEHTNIFTALQTIDLASDAVGLIIEGAASQTNDHFRIRTSGAGDTVFLVDRYGGLLINPNGDTTALWIQLPGSVTNDPLFVEDSGGFVLLRMSNLGRFVLGDNTSAAADATIRFEILTRTTQSVNAMQMVDDLGVIPFSIGARGQVIVGSSSASAADQVNFQWRMGPSGRTSDIWQTITTAGIAIFRQQSTGTVLVGGSSTDATNVGFTKLTVQGASTETASLLTVVSGIASTTTLTVNQRAVLSAGRISHSVLFTDDNTSPASSKLLALSLTGITAATTRTWTVGNYSGIPAVPTNEGTLGQFLKSNGAGAQPSWDTPAGGSTGFVTIAKWGTD